MIKFILSKNHLSFCHNKQIQPPRHLSPINKIINNILLIRYNIGIISRRKEVGTSKSLIVIFWQMTKWQNCHAEYKAVPRLYQRYLRIQSPAAPLPLRFVAQRRKPSKDNQMGCIEPSLGIGMVVALPFCVRQARTCDSEAHSCRFVEFAVQHISVRQAGTCDSKAHSCRFAEFVVHHINVRQVGNQFLKTIFHLSFTFIL